MSGREDAREILRELLHEALGGATGNGSGSAHADGMGGAPMVPPPPVAAVHRPSTWAPAHGATEPVTIETDADLERFVHALLARAGRDGEAIRAGRLRFTLQRRGGAAPAAATGAAPGGAAAAAATGPASGGGTILIERGAVTERTVEKAAKAGARLVLGARAVPTPLAREKARALGIEFERER